MEKYRYARARERERERERDTACYFSSVKSIGTRAAERAPGVEDRTRVGRVRERNDKVVVVVVEWRVTEKRGEES